MKVSKFLWGQKIEVVKNGIKIFHENFKGFKPDIYGGIGEEMFSGLFKSFFKNLRK